MPDNPIQITHRPLSFTNIRKLSQILCNLNDTFHLISCEMLQMHGGIGMTDEADIGFYMKRARVAAATFGDSAFHRDRYATLEGY